MNGAKRNARDAQWHNVDLTFDKAAIQPLYDDYVQSRGRKSINLKNLTNDHREWIEANSKHRVQFGEVEMVFRDRVWAKTTIRFSNEDDAVLFKLFWC